MSFRLTGGPDAENLAGAQGGGLSEGWSDFFALVLNQTSSPEAARGVFTFWLGDPPDGAGIRSVVYSPDLAIDPLTFGRYNRRRCHTTPGVTTCSEHCSPAECTGSGQFLSSHAVGEIWASTLWDIYWKLCDPALHGRSNDLYRNPFDAYAGGENVALQLVVDGLKLQPANPTFLEARDAILIADSINFARTHLDVLWEAFADRGMGWGACDNWISSGNPPYCWIAHEDSTEVLEDFTAPPLCTVRGTVYHDVDCNGGYSSSVDIGLSGWTVYLDANRNGQRDSIEAFTVTDPSGNYEFSNLYPTVRDSRDWIGAPAKAPVGIAYVVSLEPQSGWKHPTTLLGNWDESSSYGDVWGDGGYAFIGHTNTTGVKIIDVETLVADPANPAAALFGTWSTPTGDPPARIQDIKARDGVAYLASDSSQYVYVVDVTDPSSPTDLSKIGSGLAGVHNIALDGDSLYLADGRTNYIPCWDVGVPANPQPRNLTPTFQVQGAQVIHDVTVSAGRLYACESSFPGRIFIYDSTLWWPTLIASFESGNLTHSAWPTEDGNHLVVTREEPGTLAVDIWDISELPAASLASQISVPASEATSPHDPRITGNHLYVSWYEAGVLVFDITDPLQAFEVSRFDTYGGLLQAETGCWGVYPFGSPARVLASDTESGLFILSFTPSVTFDLDAGEVRDDVDFAVSQTCNW